MRRLRVQNSGGGSVWKRAISVCSAVRTLLLAAPRALVSLTSAAYSTLVSGGGPSARNWEALCSVNGRTNGHGGVDRIGAAEASRQAGRRVGDRREAAVVGAQRDDLHCDLLADLQAARLRVAIRQRGDVAVVGGLVLRRAIREQALERVIRRGGRRGLEGGAGRGGCRLRREARVRAVDRVDGIEHRHVHRGEVERVVRAPLLRGAGGGRRDD